MKKIEKTIDIGGRKLTLSTGELAQQATSAVTAVCGETVVLATVVAAPLRNDPGYFPLQVEYQERLYAGGKIKGSRWVKRDGRPTDDAVLVARLIDRSIRPLFPKGYKKDVQVIITVLSMDEENTPDMLAAAAVSAALTASSIPWSGPIGTIKIGLSGDDLIVNPTSEELKTSDMELVVSSMVDSVVMIETGANEVAEAKVLEGIELAHKEGKKLVKVIQDFAKAVGIEKESVNKSPDKSKLGPKVKKLAEKQISDLITKMSTKEASYADYDEIKLSVVESFTDEEKEEAGQVFDYLVKQETRAMILSGKRPDGRKLDELRNLTASVGVLPRTHGSGLFNRGKTQALTIATLGSLSLAQLIETATGEETRRYIHHYTFPPFSVGETGRVGYPNRREVGHGALAEKALSPVIPAKEEFPYTIYVKTEILSSNGSTSMASVCGSTLSMMDAGVPLKEPVAGIAMGILVENPDKYVVLTDITGFEDGNGDMDFKVAGTKNGITALQLDVKTLMLTPKMLSDAFTQAKKARLEILGVITKALKGPREEVSARAPKIKMIKIPVDKIGEVIGPGGRMIKKIMADTGSQVDVEDDGSVSVSADRAEELDKAVETIEGIVKEVQPGELYEGPVKRIESFGAFIEILPGKDGMVHVSDMSTDFVNDPKEVVKIGQVVKVKVKEVDDRGRINLTMLLDAEIGSSERGSRGRRGARSGGGRGGQRFGGARSGGGRVGRSGGFSRGRGGNTRHGGGRRDSRKSGGPHFPTSRLMDDKRSS